MFWGLWAGQPGCMKMGNHKTLLNAVTSSSSEHEIHLSMEMLDMIYTNNSVNGYDGIPMKHCKVCVGGGLVSIDAFKGNDNSKRNLGKFMHAGESCTLLCMVMHVCPYT